MGAVPMKKVTIHVAMCLMLSTLYAVGQSSEQKKTP